MREILFRGKRVDNGEWMYGCLVIADERYFIATYPESIRSLYYPDDIYVFTSFVEVIPSTVGQYTGLADKNGNLIFEGDIVKSCEYDDVYFVKYFDNDNYSAFDCVPDVPLCECNGLSYLVNEEGCKVIGNIHDNPELLKGGVDNG